ncbi:hypothetical protein [Nocardia sp. NPDC059239]|uniref:hypothetical protein n=1 Tax=Nocardia sp. NPDC059239 TaxID=3346785 RepID=UPI0036BD3C2E
MLLDGEIAVLGASGAPSFGRLQHRVHVQGTTPRIAYAPAVFIAFDLLRKTQ